MSYKCAVFRVSSPTRPDSRSLSLADVNCADMRPIASSLAESSPGPRQIPVPGSSASSPHVCEERPKLSSFGSLSFGSSPLYKEDVCILVAIATHLNVVSARGVSAL